MIVIPGDLIGELDKGKFSGDYYSKNGKIFSKYISLLEKNKLTSLCGVYMPRKDDLVIGKVIDVYPNGWLIDINSPYTGFLLTKEATEKFIDVSKDDLNDIYTYGDFLVAKITNVMKNKIINLTTKEKGLGKLSGGIVISISPKKIPRVIGKNSSMINNIKNILELEIVVGQNGRIWLKGKDRKSEILAIKAIKMIEKYSHCKRLTDNIKRFLEKNKNAEI
ncbi:MAG: exosome complex RNA-binding protein Rrp4 [Nanopusillaceae archaeon]